MNNYKDNKTILNILNLLNDNYYLKGTLDNKEYLLFYKEDDKIKVSSSLYHLKISKNEFIELYKDYSFSLIEDKEEVIENKDKDLDYYSRLQKKGIVMVIAAFILNLLSTIGCGIGVICSILRLLIVLGVILTGSINGNVNGGITIQMLNNTNDPYSSITNGIVIAFAIILLVISIIYFVGNLLFTIFSYKVYKNKMKNNLAISILDLIFGNVISGILLIIDFADKKEKGEIN